MNQIERAFTDAGFVLTHQGGNIMNWQRNGAGFVQIISDEDGGGPVTDNALPVIVGTYRVDGDGVMVEDDFDNSALIDAGWTDDDVLKAARNQADGITVDA
jgi:hypothetical protein